MKKYGNGVVLHRTGRAATVLSFSSSRPLTAACIHLCTRPFHATCCSTSLHRFRRMPAPINAHGQCDSIIQRSHRPNMTSATPHPRPKKPPRGPAKVPRVLAPATQPTPPAATSPIIQPTTPPIHQALRADRGSVRPRDEEQLSQSGHHHELGLEWQRSWASARSVLFLEPSASSSDPD